MDPSACPKCGFVDCICNDVDPPRYPEDDAPANAPKEEGAEETD